MTRKKMSAAGLTKRGWTDRGQGYVWLVVLLVTLLHFSGVLFVKYGWPDLFAKRKSEITIELGGQILRGAGGEGVRQAAPAVKSAAQTPVTRTPEATRTLTTPAPPSAASSATAESSTAAGMDAAPTTDADYKAAYLHNPKPPYPALAFQMRIEGTVLLKALVLPDGTCAKVLLTQSSGNPDLDRSALTTVAQWKFVPAKSQGKDVSQWVSIPITFALKRR